MRHIFVNLKRFEVSRNAGGICPLDTPQEWVRGVIRQTAAMRFGRPVRIVFLLPEGLLCTAAEAVKETHPDLSFGCQGVHWDDIAAGGNFGAFTSLLPAKAAVGLGCRWAMIGHSEERRAKLELLTAYDPRINEDAALAARAARAVNGFVNREVLAALRAGLSVLLCVGENAEEKGAGDFEAQQPRVREVLEGQLTLGLNSARDLAGHSEIVIGYEPVWAIGPGRTPPGADYIGFVSTVIKEVVQRLHGFTPPVVYGGGLKEENAAMLARVATIEGGLVGLTRFTPPIAFEPEGLRKIVETYLEAAP
jgi:triosephosphate isomerase